MADDTQKGSKKPIASEAAERKGLSGFFFITTLLLVALGLLLNGLSDDGTGGSEEKSQNPAPNVSHALIAIAADDAEASDKKKAAAREAAEAAAKSRNAEAKGGPFPSSKRDHAR